jgi:hypothetical protein
MGGLVLMSYTLVVFANKESYCYDGTGNDPDGSDAVDLVKATFYGARAEGRRDVCLT